MEPRIWFMILSAIALFTAVNSPIFEAMLVWTPFLVPDFIRASFAVLLFVHTLLIGFGLVVLGGVPTAMFERVFARPRGDDVTMVVWTVSTAALCAATLLLG